MRYFLAEIWRQFFSPEKMALIKYTSYSEPSLQFLQSNIGGYVAEIRLSSMLSIFCDEDGIEKKLKINEEASRIAQKKILGTAVLWIKKRKNK